jgi:hypothetical protein
MPHTPSSHHGSFAKPYRLSIHRTSLCEVELARIDGRGVLVGDSLSVDLGLVSARQGRGDEQADDRMAIARSPGPAIPTLLRLWRRIAACRAWDSGIGSAHALQKQRASPRRVAAAGPRCAAVHAIDREDHRVAPERPGRKRTEPLVRRPLVCAGGARAAGLALMTPR